MTDTQMPVMVKIATPSPETTKNKYSPRHLLELSTPKESRATWWTSFDPNLTWGNQEHMWPIKEATLSAVASPRVLELAQPKTDHSVPGTFIHQFYYGCGRSSQIWTIPLSALHASPSQRIRLLARHKSAPPVFLDQHIPQYYYGCGRSSGIWEFKRRSLTCPTRPHTARLAKPKQLHPEYMACKPPQSVVTEAAKLYEITPNLDYLAKPKPHFDGPYRDAQWPVSNAAKEAIAGERLLDLSKSRKLAEGYMPCRGVIWKVGVGALNAVTSNRMEELAKPIIRDTMDHVQFNPDVFNVSEAAKKAKASPRIEELAEPIRRGNK